MGFLDRLLGREEQPAARRSNAGFNERGYPPEKGAPANPDEAAIERYRYLLKTAPPDQIEQAHAEAFAQLTPEQRQQVLEDLSRDLPEAERARDSDPRSLARMATRAEMRQPGTMERSLSRGGMGGMGMGGMLAGSLFASVAGAFVGTAIADAMFDFNDSGDASADGGDAAADSGGADAGGADAGGPDAGGADAGGGGFGDFGGDFGGGDFGGM